MCAQYRGQKHVRDERREKGERCTLDRFRGERDSTWVKCGECIISHCLYNKTPRLMRCSETGEKFVSFQYIWEIWTSSFWRVTVHAHQKSLTRPSAKTPVGILAFVTYPILDLS